MAPTLDLDFVRAQFPAFAEPSPAESTQASASTPRKALVLVSDGHVVPPSSPDVKSDAFKTATGTVDASLKAFAPLILTTLPPAIQLTLSWMRKGKEEAIARDVSLAPSPEMSHDLRLLRFLIGHNDEAMNRLSGMKGAGALYKGFTPTLLRMVVGDVDPVYYEMLQVDEGLGVVYFIIFVVLFLFVLTSLFLAITSDAYAMTTGAMEFAEEDQKRREERARARSKKLN